MRNSLSLSKMANVIAKTYRSYATPSAVTAAPVLHLDDLEVMPLMPVMGSLGSLSGQDIVLRYGLKSPRDSYVTYTSREADVIEGDILEVESVQYTVRAALPWPEYSFLELVVERVIGT